jgi:hypothetical protein
VRKKRLDHNETAKPSNFIRMAPKVRFRRTLADGRDWRKPLVKKIRIYVEGGGDRAYIKQLSCVAAKLFTLYTAIFSSIFNIKGCVLFVQSGCTLCKVKKGVGIPDVFARIVVGFKRNTTTI